MLKVSKTMKTYPLHNSKGKTKVVWKVAPMSSGKYQPVYQHTHKTAEPSDSIYTYSFLSYLANKV